MDFDIVVIGLGYIGLPTASIFATKGKRVLGVDIREDVVKLVNQGRIHIVEPELDVLVQAATQSGRLRAGTAPAEAGTFIIAVPTPFKHGQKGHEPDLAHVESASRSIAPWVGAGSLVVLESTSPVGTTEKVKAWVEEERILRRLPPVAALYAHCPERILPGQMIKELVTNDRICGGLTPEASSRARELYGVFCTGSILLTDARTAEMVKLTENASRDVGIAFANELSMICDRLGIDVWEVVRLANHHPRVKILRPGPGVGGHCIAVDPWFLVDSAPEEARLIRTAREVNDHKPHFVLKKIRERAASFSAPRIACLGLAFKADVDDLRESPSLDIVLELARSGFRLLVAEPYVAALPPALALPNVTLTDAETAVRGADIVVLLVNHRQFVALDRELLGSKVVIDTRGVWNLG